MHPYPTLPCDDNDDVALPILAIIWRRSIESFIQRVVRSLLFLLLAPALKFNKSNDATIKPKAHKSIQNRLPHWTVGVCLRARSCVYMCGSNRAGQANTNYDVWHMQNVKKFPRVLVTNRSFSTLRSFIRFSLELVIFTRKLRENHFCFLECT